MLKELTERIKSINFNQILDEVLDDERFFILDLIRSQLIKGEGGNGKLDKYAWYKRKSKRSKEWIDYKHEIGLFSGGGDPEYDLFGDTGELYRSLVATIKAEYIEIEFASAKLPLVEASTEMKLNDSNVLTLDPTNLQILIDRIKPKIQQKINDRIGI